MLTSGFVVIRNLRASSDWSEQDLAAAQYPAAPGPFWLIGSGFDAGSRTLRRPGMRIIAWFSEALATLSPVSDTTLPSSVTSISCCFVNCLRPHPPFRSTESPTSTAGSAPTTTSASATSATSQASGKLSST